MTPAKPPTNVEFALGLRRLIPAGSLRAVAREFDPESPERGKRNLNRWISARVLPSAENRDRLAGILGVDSSELPLPGDVEPDADAPLTREELREFRRLALRIERQLAKVAA